MLRFDKETLIYGAKTRQSSLYRQSVYIRLKTKRSSGTIRRIEFEWVLAAGVVVILIYRGRPPLPSTDRTT